MIFFYVRIVKYFKWNQSFFVDCKCLLRKIVENVLDPKNQASKQRFWLQQNHKCNKIFETSASQNTLLDPFRRDECPISTKMNITVKFGFNVSTTM